MATEKREVELILKANDLSSKQLKEVSDAIDDLSRSLDKQVEASKRGETTLGELKNTYGKLAEAQKALTGKDALVKSFQNAAIAVEKAAEKAQVARTAFNALASEQANYSEVTKKQDDQLRKLANSAKAADESLAKQQSILASITSDLQTAGISTANLAESENLLVSAARNLAAAQEEGRQAIDGFAEAQRRLRKEQEAAATAAQESSDRISKAIDTAFEAHDQKVAAAAAATRKQIEAEKELEAEYRKEMAADEERAASAKKHANAIKQAAEETAAFQAKSAHAQREVDLAAAFNSNDVALRKFVVGMRNGQVVYDEQAASTRKATKELEALKTQYQQVTTAQEKSHAAGKKMVADNPFESHGRTTLSLLQRIRGEVLALTAAYVGLQAAIGGISSVLEAINTNQQIQSKLLVLTGGNAAEAAQEYQYLSEQAERLGIFLPDLANSYTSFAIAARKANISSKDTRFIFERIAESGRVLHLSADDMKGVFKAIEQMVSKGQVMSEELKGQLGERLPGALQLAAAGMKKTVPEFVKALEGGNVKAREGLLAIAREADKTFGAGLAKATGGLGAMQERFKTALYNFKLAIASSGLEEAFTPLLKKMTEFFQSDKGTKLAEDLAKGFAKVGDALIYVLDNLDPLVGLFKVFVELYVAKEVFNLTVAMAQLPAKVTAVQTAFLELSGTMQATMGSFAILSAAFVGWEIGTILYDKFEEVRKVSQWLVSVLDEAWTHIKYNAETVWETITSSWQDAGIFLINSMTKTFREILGLMQKAANVVGATGIGEAIGKTIDTITLQHTEKAKKRVAQLEAEMKVELDKIAKVQDEILADRPEKKATKKADRTEEESPGSELKFGDSDKAAKKLLNEYKSLLAEVDAVTAQSLKKNKGELESILEGIDTQYAALFRKIAEFGANGGKGAAELTTKLHAAVEELKRLATEDYGKKQIKTVQDIEKALTAAKGKIAKSDLFGGEADVRQNVADSFAQVYEKIATLDEKHQGNLKEQTDEIVKQTQELQVQKYYKEQAKKADDDLNNLVKERDDRIKTQIELTQGGLQTEAQQRENIKQIIEATQPAIEATADATIKMLEGLRGQVDNGTIDMMIAKVNLLKDSSKKLKTELYSAAQANQDLTAGLTGALDKAAEGFGNAVAGVESFGDAVKDAGRAFVNFAAEFLRKIATMIAQQIILNALQDSMGGAKGSGVGGVISGIVTAMTSHDGSVVGQGAGVRSRAVPASWFADAPRYHSGGIAGMAPDEYPAILKRNEEVLTANDPRNILNGGGAGGASPPVVQDVKVVNTIDSGSFVSEGLSTPDGTRAVFNFIRANRSQVKSILG